MKKSELVQLIKEVINEENQRRDLSDYIVKDGNKWYIAREDEDNDEDLVHPGDIISFTYEGKSYKAKVSIKAVGRDDDNYRIFLIQ